MRTSRWLSLIALVTVAGCGGTDTDIPAPLTQATQSTPAATSQPGGGFSLAATRKTTTDGGDSYTMVVSIADPQPAASLPEVSRALAGCAPWNQTRMLFAPIQIRTTLNSALPVHLRLQVDQTPYIAHLSSGITCISYGGVGLDITSKGSSKTLTIWYVLLDQITPKHPRGDPETLSEKTFDVTLGLDSARDGETVTYGPRVCDNNTIHLIARPPKDSGCGTHLTAPTP